MTECDCQSDMYGGGDCRCRCCLDAPDMKEEIARLRARVDELEGAMRPLLTAIPRQMATVADADRLRPHIDHARRVLGEDGKDGG